MRLFVDYIATKKSSPCAGRAQRRDRRALRGDRRGVHQGDDPPDRRAAEAGAIRADIDPNDIFRALLGFTYGSSGPAGRRAR